VPTTSSTSAIGFSGKQLLMMLDISMGSVLYPDRADNLDPTTWVELDLSD